MYFGLPDDALTLRDGLREVLTTACTPAVIRAAWDGDSSVALWKTLGSFGLPGLLASESTGGLGLDELSFVAALEEAGWHGVPGPLVETLVSTPVLDLPLDGSARIAVKRHPGPVPWACTSTHVLDTSNDLRLLDVTQAALTPVDTVDRARQLADVSGDGSAPSLSSEQLALLELRGTLGTAAFLLGLARRQVDLTVAYVKERKQFGVPIGTFQAVKHPLADAIVGTEFAWPAALRAAHSLATGDPQAALHVSMAKALASEASYRVSRVCLQAHGAMGYTVEYDLHLFAKRTWALAKDWGTAEQHRAIVAREIVRGRTAL
ncbi:MAG: acyl-CoA dehydrogenase [Frankiales bacterium]|nr:acyl-CoA dehydrogenase [Frankiales bacterium]